MKLKILIALFAITWFETAGAEVLPFTLHLCPEVFVDHTEAETVPRLSSLSFRLLHNRVYKTFYNLSMDQVTARLIELKLRKLDNNLVEPLVQVFLNSQTTLNKITDKELNESMTNYIRRDIDLIVKVIPDVNQNPSFEQAIAAKQLVNRVIHSESLIQDFMALNPSKLGDHASDLFSAYYQQQLAFLNESDDLHPEATRDAKMFHIQRFIGRSSRQFVKDKIAVLTKLVNQDASLLDLSYKVSFIWELLDPVTEMAIGHRWKVKFNSDIMLERFVDQIGGANFDRVGLNNRLNKIIAEHFSMFARSRAMVLGTGAMDYDMVEGFFNLFERQAESGSP